MNRDILRILYKNSDIFRKNKVKLDNISIIDQNVEGNKLNINFNNHNYKFEESNINANHYILYSKEDDNCVIVIISKKDNTAEIHGIGNYKTCLYESNQNVGSILLKLTIKMLKKYKNKFNIKMIILADNSLKQCGKNNIKLSLMLTLITGDTWYGKYGFRPIDYQNDEYIIDKFNTELYEKNKKIINKLKISDIDLLKFIKLTNNKGLIKATNKILELNPDMLVKDYLRNMLSNYDKTCENFIKFYEYLFNEIMMFDPCYWQYGLIL
jgi:hypothetical protein